MELKKIREWELNEILEEHTADGRKTGQTWKITAIEGTGVANKSVITVENSLSKLIQVGITTANSIRINQGLYLR